MPIITESKGVIRNETSHHRWSRISHTRTKRVSISQAEQPSGRTRENQLTPLRWQRKHVVLLFVSIVAIYILLAWIHYIMHPFNENQHFIYLADGWLHGHLYLHNVPPDTEDYTLHNGHWYVAFPPLPAVFLLPLVAIFHLSYQGLISLVFSVGMGILNIWLMLEMLKRLPQQQSAGLTFEAIAWLVVLFALGTEHLYAAMQGNVWFTAHIVATTFLLLYIGETLNKRRPLVAGIYLGLAALTRSTTLFTFPFFVLLTISASFASRQEGVQRNLFLLWKDLLSFFAVLGVFIVGMLIYNQARFGSLFDFGYSTMYVNSFVGGNLHTYGQFNPHFILTNLRYMLLEPLSLVSYTPYLSFNPLGTGIFWTTPALVLAFLAFRRKEHHWLAAALLAACLLPMAFLLMYFNTGWYQFGYRFILDFLPFVFLLAVLAMPAVPGWREKLLIVLSIAMNVWGFLVFTFFHP
jgi:hypothetical protein